MPPPRDPRPCAGSACGARSKAGFFAKAVKAATCTRGFRGGICLCGFCAGRTRLAAHAAGSVQECLDERRGRTFAQGEGAWKGRLSKARKTKPAAAMELQQIMEIRCLLLRPFGTDLYDNYRHDKA